MASTDPKLLDSLLRRFKSLKTPLTGLGNQHNDQEPREPPPPPTPLEFPRLYAPGTEDVSILSKEEITKLFSSFPRNGPSMNYISALNIRVTHNVGLEQLLSSDYLPPSTWLTETVPSDDSDLASTQTHSSKVLSNGASIPDHAVFYKRAKELLLTNDVAFAFLQRKPQVSPGPPVRVIHFRKFFEHLLGMAEFWDTSLDKYITPRESHRTSLRSISRSGLRSLSRSPFRKRSRSPSYRAVLTSPPDSPSEETSYTGRRIGCGVNMPIAYREDTVCAFVQTIAWAFKCSVERPKSEPKLQIGGMIMPITQTASVYRNPRDPEKAKKGVLEGPLMGIQCRNMHSFKKEGEREGEARGEVLDFLKETGLAIMIAQKRLREGTTEQTKWKGKWWVEQRRWGGGTGMQISLVEAASQPKSARASEDIKRVPEKYIKLHPPTSTWERNVAYMQIGKDRSSEYDEIYLISSLNHHISILHFQVAQPYTDFITNLSAPSTATSLTDRPRPSQEAWSVLSAQRSRWYDLLKIEDRAEAMRGIWGILGWLMRNTESQAKVNVQMGGTET